MVNAVKNRSILLVVFVVVGFMNFAPASFAQTPADPAMPGATTAPMTREQAAQRFRQGEAFEHKHNLRAAYDAYLEAGEAGNGDAQKKLGDLYGNGNAVVERNYETSLKWYHKAREQGMEIPGPLTYPGTPVLILPR